MVREQTIMTEQEIQALINERDALTAKLSLAKSIFNFLFALGDAVTREEIETEVDVWLQLKAAFDAAPQALLQDIKAERDNALAELQKANEIIIDLQRTPAQQQIAELKAKIKEEAYNAYWDASDSNRADRWTDNFDESVRKQFEKYWAENHKEGA